MYFEAKAETGSIQIDDNTRFYQLVYAKRHNARPYEQNPGIEYGITGEAVRQRTVYYVEPLYASRYENKFVFWRNPTDVPMHVFPATFNIFVNNLYSTAFYAVPVLRNNKIAISNCTEDEVKNIECYVFDYSSTVRTCKVGIEIRNAANQVIFNSAKGNRPLKFLRMGQFTHCAYGSESGRGTDFEETFSFSKEIAINIGYRGLYNYTPPSGNAATINRDARFVVPILTRNSIKFTTCYQNNFCNYTDWSNSAGFYGITQEGYYDASGTLGFRYASDRFTFISGGMPCNKTTYAIADVTDYYNGTTFYY